MKRKKEKEYWLKRKELFPVGTDAHSRAAELRNCEHVAHVRVTNEDAVYVVSYSVAKWYLADLDRAGIKL